MLGAICGDCVGSIYDGKSKQMSLMVKIYKNAKKMEKIDRIF